MARNFDEIKVRNPTIACIRLSSIHLRHSFYFSSFALPRRGALWKHKWENVEMVNSHPFKSICLHLFIRSNGTKTVRSRTNVPVSNVTTSRSRTHTPTNRHEVVKKKLLICFCSHRRMKNTLKVFKCEEPQQKRQ